MKIIAFTIFLLFAFDSLGASVRPYQPQEFFKKNKCQKWAKLHKSRRQKGLVGKNLTIGFEGFLSYSSRAVKSLNKYQQSATNQRMKTRGSGFLTRQFLNRLPKGSSEFLVLPNTAYKNRSSKRKRTKLLRCIQQFKNENPDTLINLVGHSFGGAAAKKLEEDLESLGIEVNHTTTFDPRDWSRWSRVTYRCFASSCRNYRQRRPLMGASMDEDGERAVDLDVTREGLGHGKIPSYKPALEHFKALLN